LEDSLEEAWNEVTFQYECHPQTEVRLHIEETTTKYAKQASKGRLPSKSKSKLMPRTDGPFRIIEKVNDDAYKVDLPGDYNISTTFNVKDLTPYLDEDDDSDLRTNHFQPGADDVHHGNYNSSRKLNLICKRIQMVQ
jgi:hypothetical protein